MWTAAVINALWLVLFVLVLVVPLPGRETTPSTVVEYRDGRPAYVFLSPDDKWRLPVELARVDPKFVEALVALEDKRFWDHDGVDTIAVVRAAISNLTSGRRVSGGSTISMQLARLLEPRPRTVPSKLLDMFRALQLDVRMSKRELLEEYLARTPYGENVEGIESASWSYFGHGAQHLTPLEIATLLAVPQGPARFAPNPANTARLRARRDAILGKLIAAGVVRGVDAESARVDAADSPPPDHQLAMPREVPHAAISLHARFPDRHRIRSTLDPGAQKLVEREVALHAPELRRKRIHNAAVVVVDHHTREVVALVGSLDFADSEHGGQIAMFERPRSPGSTLKPFLYAFAIDRGLALPGYLVADVPSTYGTYQPRNFDGDWSGLVTLNDSLSRSLNLPFVDLMQALGVESFLGELERMAVAHARVAPGQYGLSLIAGGMELTPLELAGMYATLAEDGTYAPLRLTRDAEATAEKTPIFNPGAAFLTRQTLEKKDRPDFPRRRDTTPLEIHWKTGTSFGFRDAWAAGSGPRYTAVVWTGNVDMKGSSDLVGSDAAAPLLFDVLEGVRDRSRTPVPEVPPPDLTPIEVCAYSGHVPSESCNERTTVLAPIHAVPTKPCPFHHAYEVDRETQRAVLPSCRVPGRDYERRSFVVLPSSITAWFLARNRVLPEQPVFADNCAADPNLAPPAILMPSLGQVVTLMPGVATERQQIPLSASSRSAQLSWFVDGAHLGTVRSNERLFWTPTIGTHDLVVSDEAGRKARRTLEVKLAASQAP